MNTKEKEKENGSETETRTRTRSYAIAGTIAIAFALIAAIMVMPAAAQLADTPWPMFGHDLQHTGVSPYVGAQEPTVKWSVQTSTGGGGVSAQPVIDSDGTIYIGTTACSQGKFYAFNPDGKEKWTFAPSGCNEFWGSAAIGEDGTIYVPWCSCYAPAGIVGEGMLYALNPDGSVKWQFGMVPYRVWGPSAIAIGADGTIYWAAGNKLYAVNPDGTEQWNFTTTTAEMISGPTIGADGTIYAVSRDHNLYAINPDGTEKWQFETGDKIYYYPVVGSDGTIYVGSKDHNLYAINPDGTEKWQFDTGETVRYPAVGSDGTIYVSAGNTLWAIDPDGNEKWHFTTGGRARVPVIGADGTIYFGSYDKKVYALNPDGTEKWNLTTDYEVGGAPSIGADGTVYVPSGRSCAGAGASKFYAIGPGPAKPAIEVNKTVWDPVNETWVEKIDAKISQTYRFRCEVHNNGTCCDLTNIKVVDTLSDSLEYANNATVDGVPRESDWISGNQFGWNFAGPLAPCETITIKFDAHMIKCRNGTNTLNATAWCDKTKVSDEDTVWVNCRQHPLWKEINKELDSLKGNVSAATMPSIIQRRLVDKLEYAKELKENAKIECEAGNFDGATKKLGVAKSQVESFASMVKITRRIKPADKASFLADSTEIIAKIQTLIGYVETEHKC